MNKTFDGPGPFTQVRESDDARGIIGKYSKIQIEKEKGNRAWIRCPFHNDNNASMSSREGDKSWRCWVCGKSYSAVDVIAEVTGQEPKRVAIDILNGGHFEVNQSTPTPKIEPPPNPQLNSAVLAYAHCQIPREFCMCGYHRTYGCTARTHYEKSQVIEALKYMKTRGIDPKAASKVLLGIGSGSNKNLIDFLLEQGFSAESDGWNNLFRESNNPDWGDWWFRFRGYLIFGEPQAKGNVAWLCGRSFKADSKLPHNHQGGKPQGLVLGASSLPTSKPYTGLITEGTIDYAIARQWGYSAICINGTGNTSGEAQQREADSIARALRGASVVVAAMDADDAGNTAFQNLKVLLGDRLRALKLPDGVNDIGDLGPLPDGREQFRTAFSRAIA